MDSALRFTIKINMKCSIGRNIGVTCTVGIGFNLEAIAEIRAPQSCPVLRSGLQTI